MIQLPFISSPRRAPRRRPARAFLRAAGLAAGCVILAACTTPEERAAAQAEQERVDHAQCVGLNFEPGTEAYGHCRLRLMEARARTQGYGGPNVSVGLGVGFGF